MGGFLWTSKEGDVIDKLEQEGDENGRLLTIEEVAKLANRLKSNNDPQWKDLNQNRHYTEAAINGYRKKSKPRMLKSAALMEPALRPFDSRPFGIDKQGGDIEMEMDMRGAEGMGMREPQSLVGPRQTYSPTRPHPQNLPGPSGISRPQAGSGNGPRMGEIIADVRKLSMDSPFTSPPPNQVPEQQLHGLPHGLHTLATAAASAREEQQQGLPQTLDDLATAAVSIQEEQQQRTLHGLNLLATAAISAQSMQIKAPTRAENATSQSRRERKDLRRRQARQQQSPIGQARAHSSSSSPGPALSPPTAARSTRRDTGGKIPAPTAYLRSPNF